MCRVFRYSVGYSAVFRTFSAKCVIFLGAIFYRSPSWSVMSSGLNSRKRQMYAISQENGKKDRKNPLFHENKG